jgi:hypothetical protein
MPRFDKKKKKKKTVDNNEISNDFFQGKESELGLYKYIHKIKLKIDFYSKEQ